MVLADSASGYYLFAVIAGAVRTGVAAGE